MVGAPLEPGGCVAGIAVAHPLCLYVGDLENMDETALYVKLAQTAERLKGSSTWTDILLAIKRAQERKVREQLDSLFSDMPFEVLAVAERIASKEVYSKPPPLPPPAASEASKPKPKKAR